MKLKYEYQVNAVGPDGYPVSAPADTRKDARQLKNDLSKLYSCTNTKIVQRKYVLTEQKEIR